jgi:hypothetical protein
MRTGVYVRKLLSKQKKPSLINLVNIYEVFNYSIVDLLLGKKFNLIVKSEKLGERIIEVNPHKIPKPFLIEDVLAIMEKHLASPFLTHCTYKIGDIVNHEFGSLSIISPKLERSLSIIYSRERRKNYEKIIERVYLEDVKKHKLLLEVLKILKNLKTEGIEIAENNIKERLGNKTNSIDNHTFWIILRIAMYELGYMKE